MAKETPPYVVLVRDLPVHRTFEVPPARVAEWVKGMPMRDALDAPVDDPHAGHGTAVLDLYQDGAHAFAQGTFKGALTVACSRCVGPAVLTIDEPIRVTFLPRDEMPADDAETESRPLDDADDDLSDAAELGEGDLDVFPYDGEHIDLEPLFREQFVLAVPYAPLCREDCAGLCPQCGIDRNTSTCTCEPPIDPRLAPLAALKGLKSPS